MRVWVRQQGDDDTHALKLNVPQDSDVSDLLCMAVSLFSFNKGVRAGDLELKKDGERLDNRVRIENFADVVFEVCLRPDVALRSSSPTRSGGGGGGITGIPGFRIAQRILSHSAQRTQCTSFRPAWNNPEACTNCNHLKLAHDPAAFIVRAATPKRPGRSTTPVATGSGLSSTHTASSRNHMVPPRGPVLPSTTGASVRGASPRPSSNSILFDPKYCDFRPAWNNNKVCGSCGYLKTLHAEKFNQQPSSQHGGTSPSASRQGRQQHRVDPTNDSAILSSHHGGARSPSPNVKQQQQRVRVPLWEPKNRSTTPKRKHAHPSLIPVLALVFPYLVNRDLAALSRTCKAIYLSMKKSLTIRKQGQRRLSKLAMDCDSFYLLMQVMTPEKFSEQFTVCPQEDVTLPVLRALCLVIFNVVDNAVMTLDKSHLLQLICLEGINKITEHKFGTLLEDVADAVSDLVSEASVKKHALSLIDGGSIVLECFRFLTKVVETSKYNRRS